MRRVIELPEFTDLGALPAADGGGGFGVELGRGELVGEGPAPDLGAVEFEFAEAEDFTGGEAVVGGRRRAEAFAQEGQDVVGPDGNVIAAGGAGRPVLLLLVGAGGEIIGVQHVKAAAGEMEFARGLAGVELLCAELCEDVTDQRSGEAVRELVFFMCGKRNAKRTRRESARLDLTLWN